MKKTPPAPPGAALGVLGGGQLGRMFALAAAKLGYRVIAYSDKPDCPASQVCAKTYTASFDDTACLRQFAAEVAAVTIEFENIPAQALETLQMHTLVRPGPSVLHITQNRLREKEFLARHKFPIVPFKPVKTLEDADHALRQLGTPLVCKTAGFGYDGKGQSLIKHYKDAEQAFFPGKQEEFVLEKFIKHRMEISVIGARAVDGSFAAFGPIENMHLNHILDSSLAPARLSAELGAQAIDITRCLMELMEVVGLLCVEFFVTDKESLLVNELAPRPHNSGHLSIEGCQTSQFEQQVRAVAGLPLGATNVAGAAAMANLLGHLWQNGEPHWAYVLALPGVHLHLYGKRQPAAARKMGHLTVVAADAGVALRRARSARQLLTAPAGQASL